MNLLVISISISKIIKIVKILKTKLIQKAKVHKTSLPRYSMNLKIYGHWFPQMLFFNVISLKYLKSNTFQIFEVKS